MDPASIRVLGIPFYVFVWVATIVSFGIFARRFWAVAGVLFRARAENRFDHIPRRIFNFVANVLGQKRLLNEPLIGTAHLLIFWGFVLYAGSFGWTLIRALCPVLPIPYPDEVAPLRILLEIFALLTLAGIAFAAMRRMFFPPPHLQRTGDANFILILITLLMGTFVMGQEFRAAILETGSGTLNPLERLLFNNGQQIAIGRDTAQILYLVMFWAHQGIVLFFLAYLPYSKHLHLLASPFNVFFGSLHPGTELGPTSEDGSLHAEAKRWDDFSWKQLMNAFSCAECGRCDRACPALTSGAKLSPRMVIQHLKEHVLDTAINPSTSSLSPGNGKGPLGGSVSAEELWACATCMSCMDRCPVMNEHLPVIVQMRRHLVGEGAVDSALQEALTNLGRYGNSFGKSGRLRSRWTQDLDFKIKDARKEPVDYLWFVGDYASFDPRVQRLTQLTAQIFHEGGLDFGILYEGERNAGNDARRAGEEGLFESLKDKNLQTLSKAKFRKIVTTDPHTFNSLKNEYFKNGRAAASASGNSDGIEVLHYTEVFNNLFQSGKLKARKPIPYAVTYQDPCYLGRYNGVYKAPRQVLQSLGVELREMPRNRSRSYCCGAGGGRIWIGESPGVQERPAENRIREAAALPGVETLAVTCPKDMAMFLDALKTTGMEGKFNVKDMSELVWEATKP